MTDSAFALLEAKAREMGEDHGRSAASWFFDGNTSDETYRAVLKGLEDGDPAILDSFPSGPLSNEWADSPNPSSVLRDLGVDVEDMEQMSHEDDLLSAYEDGFYSASAAAIEETARRHAWVDVDEDARYSHRGVAWRIVRQSPDGSDVAAVMIGDDAEHIMGRDDLTPIERADYCGECGQIGCTHDGLERA